MKTRILSSLVLLPLLAVVYFGGYWLLWGVLTITVLGLNEFYAGCEQVGAKPSRFIGFFSIALLYLLRISSSYVGPWIGITLMMCLIYGFNVEKRKLIDVVSTFFGIVYVGFLASFIYKIDVVGGTKSNFGPWIWLIFTIAFGTDIFAYFVGSALGKHQLCPNLSRKKTVEGSIGGILGSAILSLAFVLIFKNAFAFIEQTRLIVFVIIISVVGSVVSQLGDLAASALKRMMGMKDFGDLIPGHGGILDRFDSVLFVAPYMFVVTAFIPLMIYR